jgi:uncharacterized membrane protein
MTPGAVSNKDVVSIMVSVAAALAGFTLVFLGVAISAYLAFPAETARTVREPYRRIAGVSLAALVASLLSVAVGVFWLAGGQQHWAYVATLGLSVVQGILLLWVAVAATQRVLGK